MNLPDVLKIQCILKVKVSLTMQHIFPAFCDGLNYSLRVFNIFGYSSLLLCLIAASMCSSISFRIIDF